MKMYPPYFTMLI